MNHPEVVTECNEDGTGWRRDDKGDWWPCRNALGPLLGPREWAEKKAKEGER